MPTRAAVILPWERARARRRGQRARGRGAAGRGGRARRVDRPRRGAHARSCRCARAARRRCSARARSAAQGERDRRRRRSTVAIVDAALSPVQQRNLERAWKLQGDRPHRADPRHLRRTRGDARGRAAGRAGASRLPALAAGAVVDPPGAAARRLRLPRRARRDADRGRPAADRRAHRAAEARAGAGAPHARPAPRRAAARAVPGGRAGRLHQRRQIDAVQRADRRRRWPRATSCSRRSIRPCAGCGCRRGGASILSDTVGFISELPHELVAAFRATLEEVAEADIILHVRDAAHPDTAAQRADVIGGAGRTWSSDGALDADWPSRTIEVLNKADLLGGVAKVPVRTGRGRGLRHHRRGAGGAGGRDRRAHRRGHGDGGLRDRAGRTARGWPGCTSTARWSTRDDERRAMHVTVRLLPADRARFERRPDDDFGGLDDVTILRSCCATRRGPRSCRGSAGSRPATCAPKSGPLDLVTEADEAAERRITAALRGAFPGCVVVGEEATSADPSLLARAGGCRAGLRRRSGRRHLELRRRAAAVRRAWRRRSCAARWSAAAIHDPIGDDTAMALRGEGAWIARRRRRPRGRCASPRRCRWREMAGDVSLALSAGAAARHGVRATCRGVAASFGLSLRRARVPAGGRRPLPLPAVLQPADAVGPRAGLAAAPGGRRLLGAVRRQRVHAAAERWRADLRADRASWEAVREVLLGA